MLKDWLFLILGICALIVTITLTVDLTIQARNRLHGSPSTIRMWEHMIEKSNETISSQEKTIKLQMDMIRHLRKKVEKLYKQIEELRNTEHY